MKLDSYNSPAAFLQVVQPMLEMHESRNNLMLGIALRLVEHPEWAEIPPYFAAVDDEQGDIILAASMTPPRNILVSAEPSYSEEQRKQAISLVIHDLLSGGWHVPGITAETALSEEFASGWSAAAGKMYRVKMRMRVYELREVNPPNRIPHGQLRRATIEDTDLVAAWYYEFMKEALEEGSQEEALKVASRFIALDSVYLWEDGVPVSMAFRTRPRQHGCTVTGVYTPPDKRGRGYASACVAGLSQILLDSGYQLCNLFTDLANPTSNSIYQRIGYQPVCDFIDLVFEE